MVINVIGGLLVGVLQHGMSMGHAAESYTLLTIGDGLVAQIPALVISTAAGVIVTRVSTDQDVGEQMVNQLFSNPSVMLLSAAVLGLLEMCIRDSQRADRRVSQSCPAGFETGE